jgi:SAM-dependent methyltransferase
MDSHAFDIMAASGTDHWWWEGRRRILAGVLSALQSAGDLQAGRLYDLGCGVGTNLGVLELFGETVGLEGSHEAVDHAHRLGRSNVHLADLERWRSAPADFPPGSGAVVLLADVLEHLEDETSALELAEHLLRPGGVLIVTVPALPQLWGPSDEFNHHRRRYTARSLAGILSRRFAVRRLTYFNALLFLPIAVARFVSRHLERPGAEEVEMPSRPVNRMLKTIFGWESSLLRRMDFPIGVSLLCVATRR